MICWNVSHSHLEKLVQKRTDVNTALGIAAGNTGEA